MISTEKVLVIAIDVSFFINQVKPLIMKLDVSHKSSTSIRSGCIIASNRTHSQSNKHAKAYRLQPYCTTDSCHDHEPSRRSVLIATSLFLGSALCVPLPSPATSEVASSPEITDRVYLDIGLCPEAARRDRTIGDKSILCQDPEILGRITIGLYGNLLPITVSNFLSLIKSGALVGTCFSKIVPGQYILAGKQGPKRAGFLEAPDTLVSNPESLSYGSFKLQHLRPGTLSLNLSKNEDDENIRLRPNYHNASFLITTGPGPAAELDGENIVFGKVENGLDVVSAISSVPTFQPAGNLKAYNAFASLIGDERADKARALWGKPLKAVVIMSSGVL